MNRRQKKTHKYRPEKQWLQLLTVFVVGVGLVVGGLALWRTVGEQRRIDQQRTAKEIASREKRIEAIFDSLNLDDSYKTTSVNIFGDKRLYTWDNGRTHASSTEYMRFQPVDKTAKHASQAIKKAGFDLIDEPYPNSLQKEYHFKNQNDEYIRLSVVSREFNDAIMKSEQPGDIDHNASPSVVTIKVNLDDNND